MSTSDGPKDFQEIVSKLLGDGESEEFNFFHGTKEIKTSLSTYFQQVKYADYEATFAINYYPTSNFRVKPITRSSSSMYGHTEAVLSLSFSPDCRKLASGSGDGSLRFWDLYTQTPLKEVETDNWVMIVQWSPDA